MKLLKILLLLLAFINFKIQCMQENTLVLRDEIDFFNVGQGHAVLINKVGYVPLLIDAGATAHPYVADQKFEWNKGDSKSPISKTSSISKISRRILELWQSSNGNSLTGGEFSLNIIITHPDDDHLSFVPTILSELVGKSCYHSGPFNVHLFSFSAFALLGGQETKYPNQFLDGYPIQKVYTGNFQGSLLLLNGQCGLLDNSGCITHLFCPRGIQSDDNRWSIITRIEIKGLSAILNHPIESLGRYISAYDVPAGADMDILCPFGFPEWLQLKTLLDFFYKEIPNDESYPMAITDILDITHLRCEGKNFKEIAKALVEEGIEIQKLGYKYQIEEKGLTERDISPETPEDLALYLQEMNLTDGGGKLSQNIRSRLLEKLEIYFPSSLDGFLS